MLRGSIFSDRGGHIDQGQKRNKNEKETEIEMDKGKETRITARLT